MDEKTIFTVGIKIDGSFEYRVDGQWLIDNVTKDGTLSTNVLALFGILDFAKTEIKNDLYNARTDEMNAKLDLESFEEELQGGIDQIDGLDFDDFDDEDDRPWEK